MTHDPTQAREALRAHLAASAGHAPEDEADLFALGYLTSLRALLLVRFIEDTFEIELEDDDLRREHFQDLRALCALVARRQGRAP